MLALVQYLGKSASHRQLSQLVSTLAFDLSKPPQLLLPYWKVIFIRVCLSKEGISVLVKETEDVSVLVLWVVLIPLNSFSNFTFTVVSSLPFRNKAAPGRWHTTCRTPPWHFSLILPQAKFLPDSLKNCGFHWSVSFDSKVTSLKCYCCKQDLLVRTQDLASRFSVKECAASLSFWPNRLVKRRVTLYLQWEWTFFHIPNKKWGSMRECTFSWRWFPIAWVSNQLFALFFSCEFCSKCVILKIEILIRENGKSLNHSFPAICTAGWGA